MITCRLLDSGLIACVGFPIEWTLPIIIVGILFFGMAFAAVVGIRRMGR